MDINKLVGNFLGGDVANMAGGALNQVSGSVPQGVKNNLGGFAGGAAAGGVVGLLLGSKKARKIGGKAVKYGGMAAIGGLAYMAYKNYKANNFNGTGPAPAAGAPTTQPMNPQQAIPVQTYGATGAMDASFAEARVSPVSVSPAPMDSGFDPSQITDASGGDMRVALIKAMIHAAKSDGHIDAEENSRIREQINVSNLDGEEKAFLFDQLDGPADPLAVAALAKDEAQGAELYLASFLAIDLDHPDERRHLERLGDALRLPEALRAELEAGASA